MKTPYIQSWGASPIGHRLGFPLAPSQRLPTGYDPERKAHPLTSRGTTTSAISRVYDHEDPRFPRLLTGICIESPRADGKGKLAHNWRSAPEDIELAADGILRRIYTLPPERSMPHS